MIKYLLTKAILLLYLCLLLVYHPSNFIFEEE